jgi:hypothetical protein
MSDFQAIHNMLSPLAGPGDVQYHKNPDPATIFAHYIHQDHGLDQNKKQSLLTMLNSPEAMDHLLAGAAGAVLAKTVASYAEMSKPAQVLMSLAGFGLGNVVYNAFQENKFSSYDKDTAKSRINL